MRSLPAELAPIPSRIGHRAPARLPPPGRGNAPGLEAVPRRTAPCTRPSATAGRSMASVRSAIRLAPPLFFALPVRLRIPSALRLVALLGVAAPATLSAVPAAEIVELAEAPVTLLAPADGSELTGGSWAELAWAPRAGFAELVRAEEWELFLSVDGGRSFVARLTPHLDRELRHVSFRVPDLPTSEARFLFRYGDERREYAFRLPARFASGPAPSDSALDLAASRATAAIGESPLPGSPGVVLWADGARDGSSATALESRYRAGFERGEGSIDDRIDARYAAEESDPRPLAPVARLLTEDRADPPVALVPPHRAVPLARTDRLHLLRRLNE